MILLSLLAWASLSVAETSEVQPCTENCSKGKVQKFVEDTQAVLNACEGPICGMLEWNYKLSQKRENKPCSEFFVNKNGKLGSAGQQIYNEISKRENNSSFFKNTSDILGLCPQFPEFSPEMKKYFWIHFLQNLAFHESTCDPSKVATNTPHPPAVGYFQLEKRESLREIRPRVCRGNIVIKDASNNIRCTVAMFEDQLGKIGAFGESYWWALRSCSKCAPPQRKIRSWASQFYGCQGAPKTKAPATKMAPAKTTPAKAARPKAPEKQSPYLD